MYSDASRGIGVIRGHWGLLGVLGVSGGIRHHEKALGTIRGSRRCEGCIGGWQGV